MKKPSLSKEQGDIINVLITLASKDKNLDKLLNEFNDYQNIDNMELYPFVAKFWLNKISKEYANDIPQHIEPEILALRTVSSIVELKTQNESKTNRSRKNTVDTSNVNEYSISNRQKNTEN